MRPTGLLKAVFQLWAKSQIVAAALTVCKISLIMYVMIMKPRQKSKNLWHNLLQIRKLIQIDNPVFIRFIIGNYLC